MQNDSLASLEAQTLGLLIQATAGGKPVRLSSSLGFEDMVLTDLIWRHELPIAIFTLDTGRLHPETLDHLATVEAHYGRRIEVFSPDAGAVEAWVRENGINGFRASKEQRLECCRIRKVEVLNRALLGAGVWVTGLRRAQSSNRQSVPFREHDAARGLDKLNPLADWGDAQVQQYLATHSVPVNPLHAEGYPSIGCAPCTRSITVGEDPRAGRWWWEQDSAQECGLHLKKTIRIAS